MSFIITELITLHFSWPALGAKDILQLFSMKVSSPEELMCHTVMKAGSSKECTFVLEDVGHE